MNKYNLSSNRALATNSSSGQLLKWKVGDTYIKTSTLDKQSIKTQFMFESYAEVIVSRIANRLGINAVKYKLCEVIIDNSIRTIACESKDFKPQGFSEFSFGKLMQLGKIQELPYNDMCSYNRLILDIQIVFGINVQNYIDTILLMDALTLNEDRHYGNFGLLIGNNANIKTIPLFDNGNSLFCHKHTNELTYEDGLIEYLKFKPFNMGCDIQLTLVRHCTIRGFGELKQYIPRLLSEMIQKGLPISRSKFIKDLLYNRINFLEKYYTLK